MITFTRLDLEFVLTQILQAEAGQPPVNPHLAFGLREVAGTDNNAVPGQSALGSSDLTFPTLTTPLFQTVTVNVDGTIFDAHPGVAGDTITTTYESTSGFVVDSAPRTISNLISDQTAILNPAFNPALPADPITNPQFLSVNPAALDAQAAALDALGTGYQFAFNPASPPTVDAAGNLFIPNVTPDSGLSAPFNTWFTLFGQFFDHGLDLITKGGSGTVFITLQPDDPLIVFGPDGITGTGDEVSPGTAFMVLTRATNLAGPDGLLGTADDLHAGTNTITPFVDQSQTYASDPSHQAFLREYLTGVDGRLHTTGRMLSHTNPDGSEHMATWGDVKANAFKLGFLLTDANVGNVPLLATDAFGNLIFGAHGFAQVVVRHAVGPDTLVEGTAAGLSLTHPDPADPAATVVGAGHAFINDMAHSASPVSDFGVALAPDADTVAGGTPAPGFYDNELLDAHYAAGDGRVNENVGLTAIHDVFHSEHNRLVQQIESQIQAELNKGDTSFALNWVLPGVNLARNPDGTPHVIAANEWNGERVFQAAKMGTETEYQHLVFEEFARKVAPTIHLFGNTDIHLDLAITAEFANAVYRFGHSMLDENVNRFQIQPDFLPDGVTPNPLAGTPVLDANGHPVLNAIGLIDAFTNPLAYLNQGAAAAGQIALGTTSQVGNEIDEFVTGALRNNLLGLPLDLAALNIARGRDTGVPPINLVRNEIYSQIHDATLKPYESWDDFGNFLKHPASLINFLAAYGTHASILAATTLEGKRMAAVELLQAASLSQVDPLDPTGQHLIAHTPDKDAYDFMHSLGAYANDINNPLAVHAQWSTGSITGLDTVDLWIAGLAEKQNLFGGLLGSTFNFIFETQMESLQDGDRLYYLSRLEGTDSLNQIEANTFADMIMNNTGTHHLGANIFMTPEYVVETSTVDPHNFSTWLRNPESGKLLVDVMNDGTIRFLGDDNFLGNTIVMGGTAGNDKILSGNADDDTIYGDAGNDRLDGGGGNDVVFGGTGNDTISDVAGDDILHGDAGNDTIYSGIGDDIVFGGDGNDLIDSGQGIDDVTGGQGNDIIFGGEDADTLQGNEGDDWINGGAGGDVLVGDFGAPTGQVPLYGGNDVLIGGPGGGDRMQGFSGDDIMLGLGGFDKFEGRLGFDWASFEQETRGVSVDMNRREFIDDPRALGGDAIRDFFIHTEGVSGSQYGDVLQGTNNAKVDTFNELDNVNLITGLTRYFPGSAGGAPVTFSTGNIMLGGGGSDFLEGRGGDDIIDGDARLHVDLTRDANGQIFAGSQIIREILTDQAVGPTFDNNGVRIAAGDIDTAVFSDVLANYTIVPTVDPTTGLLLRGSDGSVVVTVTHLAGAGIDGTDTLYNIERLQFSDVTIVNPVKAPGNPFGTLPTDAVPLGGLTIDDPPGTPLAAATAPAVGDTLSAASTLSDFEGVRVNGVVDPLTAGGAPIPLTDLHLQWQVLSVANRQWYDVVGATGVTFKPTDFQVGQQIRVEASWVDGLGVTETIFSAPTAVLVTNPAVNHAPIVVPQVAQIGLPDTTALENTAVNIFLPVITTFTDDTTPANLLIYNATLANGAALATAGLTFTLVPDPVNGGVSGATITGTPPAGFHGAIDILVSATDAGGLTVTDDFIINVLPAAGDHTAESKIPNVPDAPGHMGIAFNRGDLEFVLTQIQQAEAGQPPVNPHLSFGLRTVDGSGNNVIAGQGSFGSSDQLFPRLTDPLFQTADNVPTGFGPPGTTSYAQSNGLVFDSDPRIISNLISDQTANNPAALEAQAHALDKLGIGYQNQVANPHFNPALPPDPVTNPAFVSNNTATPANVDAAGNLFIPNVTPDNGLSAPFNTWFTLFGQFFDHGLDLINKDGTSGTVFIPLQPDDPLYNASSNTNFMVLTRAANLPGPDGILGTADDIHQNTNTITPFVDQSQTYASDPSHQVFLREYQLGVDNKLHSTGRMLSSTAADGSEHMATWKDVKDNALKLGIKLTDADVGNVPLLATDAYGNFIAGAHGFAQVVVKLANGTATLVEGTAAGLDLTNVAALGGTVIRTGHAFISDMAHNATPVFDASGNLLPDADLVAGNVVPVDSHGNNLVYDNELLDAHYAAGDGRVNENIGLTAIQDVFHSEHNRLVAQMESVVQAELAKGDTSFALNWVLPGANLADGIQANEWNGERVFQAAKLATETEYQHLVFEEFARKVSPTIHLFGNTDIHLDPAITAEFANVVYRFGHSMLDEKVNLFKIGADGTPILDASGHPIMDDSVGLIQAFTNPLAYLNHGGNAAGEIALGTTNQVGNEIDEFVTGALRNNLLGLPLDLAALNIARGRDTGAAPLNLARNEFYNQTHDTYLKPYESWDDFGHNLKHQASLINFVAAYGTHASITSATTLVDKRAAALALVENASLTQVDPNDPTGQHLIPHTPNQDAYDFIHSLGAYANNVNDTRAIHDAAGNAATWSTGSVTGLDSVDMWIGGLAEKQNLFGGLLGSTFNFIFETQMESLQDGDRLYYLSRLEGTHLLTEVEANSFAEMIMNNTGTQHLSANIFMTPEYVVEASTYYVKDALGNVLHNPDGSIQIVDSSQWLRNAETGKLLVDVSHDGTIHFLGDDNFLGNTIVMGGTAEADKLISGNADDDTIWGDGGNDILDGGGGNDIVYGGTGNDTITDVAGDDIIHGDAGNDTIYSGIGADIVFGGDGNDLIDGGAGIDDVTGGLGNDIIFGGEDADELQGNEGDDWINGGAGGDVLVGDVGAPTGQVPLYGGNDVLIGGPGGGDRMQGFSGDDIMLGLGGFDKFEGRLGFDWASFEQETRGVSVDMNRREFIDDPRALGGDAIRDFFIHTEGVSGSAFGDVLQGTNNAKVDTFNELTNVSLITGLDRYFPNATPSNPVAFSDGNIMLGGGGSDFIEGRGGNDIIDGDARLHVDLTRDANGQIFAGSQIIREILTDQAVKATFDPLTGAVLTAGDIDTAVFSDIAANYQINITLDAAGNILFGTDGNPVLTVTHTVPGGAVVGIDGIDTLYNMERLQFSDVTIENPFIAVTDSVAQGTLTIDDPAGTPLAAATPPAVGDVLSAVSAINDFEGVRVNGVLDAATAGFARVDIPSNELHLQWQVLSVANRQWYDVVGATGVTFAPTDFQSGQQIRVVASFVDGLGVTETVLSAPTAALVTNPAFNHAPTVVAQVAQIGLPDTTALPSTPFNLFLPLVTTFTDDTTAAANLIYTAKMADGSTLASAGLAFATNPDGAGGVTGGVISGTLPMGQYDILVSATDAGGLTVTDVFTVNVISQELPPVITSNGGGDTASTSINENLTLVTTVTATDPNPADVLTFSVAGGADGNLFTISAAGALSFKTAPDFEQPADANHDNTYVVDVRVSDGTLFDTQTIVVNVNNVNEAPVITSNGGGATASTSIAENTTAVTTVTATDQDVGAIVTFSIAGGADAAKFAINPATGALSFAAAPNFEAPTDAGANNVYDVIVRASDGSLVDTQAIAVAVTNVNEAPVITSNGAGATAAASVAENTTAVTTVTATDEDAGSVVSFSIVGGADASKFKINATTGALSFVTAPNFEVPTDAGLNNVYDVIVRASDSILFDDQALAVTVTDVNEAPVITSNGAGATAAVSVAENTTAVTTVTATDPDAGTTLSFSIVGGADASKFVIDAITGQIRFVAAPDFEAPTDVGANNVYDVIVQVSDGHGFIDTQAIAVTVTNIIGVNLTGTNNADSLTGTSENDTLTGLGGADLLFGLGGNDTLNGGAGNDTLDGGTGNDTLIGGLGNDIFIVDSLGDVVVENVGEGTDVIRTTLNTLSLAALPNVEDLTFIGVGDFIGTGNAAANTITGGSGNDILDGGAGVDRLVGGLGNDTYLVDNVADVVVEGAGGGIDTVLATSASYTLSANVENLTFTGAGNFIGTGSADNNIITGGAGANTLSGAGGDDTIFGGIGNDTLNGDAGNDVLNGDAGNDILNGGAGIDTIHGGAGADTLIGGAGGDSLFGDAGNDIFGYTIGDGADVVDGGADLDTLNIGGTAANNTLNVIFNGTAITQFEGGTVANVESFVADLLGGTDTLNFAGSLAGVTLNLATGTASGFTSIAGVENVNGTGFNDTLTGDALANLLDGGTGNDILVGGAGADTLNGSAGDDRLTGGAGNDALNGGAGNDILIFAAGFGNDTVTGFDSNPVGGQDLIDITAYHFTAANFAANVLIAAVGTETLITIAADQIHLLNVASNTVNQTDFIL